MKKICFALLLMFSIADTSIAQIGFEGGVNMANLKFKQTRSPIQTAMLRSTAYGMNIEVKLEPHLYFQTGVMLEGAGCTVTNYPSGKYFTIGAKFPLNLMYKTGEKCGNRFFFGFGPYITRYLYGEWEWDKKGAPIHPSEVYTVGVELKPLDVGIGANIGVNLKKRIYFRAHYQFGATVVSPSGDGTMKPSASGLTIGYLFGKCSRNSAKDIFYRPKDDHWRGLRFGAFWYRLRPPRYAR